MDLLSGIVLGLQTALSVKALAFCFLGVTVGTIVGVLPGHRRAGGDQPGAAADVLP